MGQTPLATALNPYATVGIDSMVFIYHIELHTSYFPLTQIVFRRVEAGKNRAVSSTLSLLEVLTGCYQRGNEDLAERYRSLLGEFPHLTLFPLDPETAELAATLRARYSLLTPDAIQVATAVQNGATAFLTNDKQLARVKELNVLLLDSYL
jgi:predicted nucleic acid-binding protein